MENFSNHYGYGCVSQVISTVYKIKCMTYHIYLILSQTTDIKMVNGESGIRRSWVDVFKKLTSSGGGIYSGLESACMFPNTYRQVINYPKDMK